MWHDTRPIVYAVFGSDALDLPTVWKATFVYAAILGVCLTSFPLRSLALRVTLCSVDTQPRPWISWYWRTSQMGRLFWYPKRMPKKKTCCWFVLWLNKFICICKRENKRQEVSTRWTTVINSIGLCWCSWACVLESWDDRAWAYTSAHSLTGTV